MAAAALLMALLGPFGSWAMPFPARLASWCLFAVGGYVCFRPVIGAARVITAHTALPMIVAGAIACALAAMPTTILVAWALAGLSWTRVPLAALAALYPQVLLIGALVTAAQFTLARTPAPSPSPKAPLSTPEAPPPASPPAVAAPAPAAFLDRLPPHLGRDLLALENEDHYVRAHTALGSTLILIRLRDAVAELAGVDGARVHRSWWVARAAIADVIRRDRAVALRLTNGLEVPVARATVPELRAAGWL